MWKSQSLDVSLVFAGRGHRYRRVAAVLHGAGSATVGPHRRGGRRNRGLDLRAKPPQAGNKGDVVFFHKV